MRRRGFCYVPFRVFMRYKSSTAAKAVGFSRKYSFILLLFSITYFLGITVSNSYSQFFQAIIHYDWLLVSLISAQKPFIWFSAHSSLILLKRQYSPFLSEIFADVMEWASSHTWYRLQYVVLYACRIITSILRTAAIFDTLTSTKKQVLRDSFIRASFNIF